MSLLTLELIRKGCDPSSLIFFPGGPGISWHYFEKIISSLDVRSSIYGINYDEISNHEPSYFDEMRFELILLLQRLPNPILITHAFSSMLLLTIARLPSLKGLVLISPAIDNAYLIDLPKRLKKYTDFDAANAAANFWINPSDEGYGDYFKTLLPFYVRSEYIKEGLNMLNQCQFSYLPYGLFVQHFALSFIESYSPTLPTLVIAGGDDHICPPDLFKTSEVFNAENIQMYIIPNAGHFPWIDHPHETIAAVKGWYDTLQMYCPSHE